MICTVATISIILQAKFAYIKCQDGRTIQTNVVVGKASTPTPIGRFRIYHIDQQNGYGENRIYAAFKKHPNGSEFAIHGDDQKLPRESLGCIRLDQTTLNQVKFTTKTIVTVRK